MLRERRGLTATRFLGCSRTPDLDRTGRVRVHKQHRAVASYSSATTVSHWMLGCDLNTCPLGSKPSQEDSDLTLQFELLVAWENGALFSPGSTCYHSNTADPWPVLREMELNIVK
jgi:hypothetical protein